MAGQILARTRDWTMRSDSWMTLMILSIARRVFVNTSITAVFWRNIFCAHFFFYFLKGQEKSKSSHDSYMPGSIIAQISQALLAKCKFWNTKWYFLTRFFVSEWVSCWISVLDTSSAFPSVPSFRHVSIAGTAELAIVFSYHIWLCFDSLECDKVRCFNDLNVHVFILIRSDEPQRSNVTCR